jgi:hypothetical protein
MNLDYKSLELFKTLKEIYPNKDYLLISTEKDNIISKDFGEFKKEFL